MIRCVADDGGMRSYVYGVWSPQLGVIKWSRLDKGALSIDESWIAGAIPYFCTLYG